MAVCGGLVTGGTRVAVPSLLFRRPRFAFTCYSSSSSNSDHVSFIKDVSVNNPPEHLNQLIKMLQEQMEDISIPQGSCTPLLLGVFYIVGESILSPGAKKGLIPLVIPLSQKSSGTVTALLRWPTAPAGMEMPVVEVHEHGVWLLAKNVDQYIHRILVEEDVKSSTECNDELFEASAEAGMKLYKKGDFAASQLSSLNIYILKKVGVFPDILEQKINQHFEKGDHVSALVTGEFYTKKEHFPGFGRPFVFNAEVLLKVGRNIEAKDAARGALKSPWWTLGCKYHEVANMAEWDDEQIEFIKEKVSDEGRLADLKKGKEPAQVALDEAAFLLDLASIEGTWDDSVERIANCYREGGLHDIANFVTYRD